MLLLASFMVRACSPLQVLDRKVSSQRLFYFQLGAFHHFRVRDFFRLDDILEKGALTLLLLLAFAEVCIFERLLDLAHVTDRVQVIGEVARQKWFRHGLLAKFHLNKQVVGLVRGYVCTLVRL